MADGSLNPIFERIELSQFPKTPHGGIAVIRSDTTVKEAVEFLHKNNILSAPVLDVQKEHSKTWRDKYLGILDVVKLCVVMLDAMEQKPKISEDEETEEGFGQFSLDPLPSEFVNLKVGELTKKEVLFPFLPLDVNSTLLDAMVLLGKFRVKRIPLIDGPEGDIVNIVSQSSMVHLLNSCMNQFRVVGDQTISSLGLATPVHVHSIRADQPAHAAFSLIRLHGISAVPVIGEDGSLIGNISARHVYYIVTARNKLRLLELPATQFLRVTADMGETAYDIKNTAIVCHPQDTLAHIIARMDAARIHRIYVVEGGRPIRTIALCDVLEKFVAAPDTGCAAQ